MHYEFLLSSKTVELVCLFSIKVLSVDLNCEQAKCPKLLVCQPQIYLKFIMCLIVYILNKYVFLFLIIYFLL